MKHLVKKYVKSAKLGDGVNDIINNTPIDEKVISEISNSKMNGYYAMAITENDTIVQTFKYKNNNNIFLIREPDPIIIYFDTARLFHKTIKEKRLSLFSKLSRNEYFSAVNGDFYWYYSTVSSYVIFLFLAIEAFINKSIPNNFEYKKNIPGKKTELYDKYQVQRNIEFLEKIKSVLPEATNKNFVSEHTHKYEFIRKLKLFRDEIVHTKSFEGKSSPNFYEDLFVMSLDFEFDETLIAARDFINYYQPNLIEECLCGNED